EVNVLTVDAAAFRALSNARAAALTQQALPLDLAAACIFSQRLAPPLISVQTDRDRTDDDMAESSGADGIPFPSMMPPQVDGSDLFSFELFDSITRHDH